MNSLNSWVAQCEVQTPKSLKEALGILNQENGAWKILAGGTDLMVQLREGLCLGRQFLNIGGLSELRGIEEKENEIRIGALVSFGEIERSVLLKRAVPLLYEAAGAMGAPAVRNRATLGGNIVNASPAADASPALLSSDAEVEMISSQGTRRIAYEEFHRGYKQTALRPEELLSAVWVPKKATHCPHFQCYFRKVGTRQAQAISKICFAARAWVEGATGTIQDLRIALGSVAPTVIRCKQTEAVLCHQKISRERVNEAKKVMLGELQPMDDLRSTAEYRKQVSLNLLEDFIYSLKVVST